MRLLVERGARVNARDRFFKSSALEQALASGHQDVALFLLKHGADDADEALRRAIEKGDLELARAALDTGRVEPLDLAAARRQAETKGSAAMKELLAAAKATRRARPPYAPAPDRLRAYAGRYRGGPNEATVSVAGAGLELAAAGQPKVDLVAVEEDSFEDASGRIAVRFGGRAGTVEGMSVNRDGEISRYGVVTSDPVPLPKASTADIGAAPRTAAAQLAVLPRRERLRQRRRPGRAR